jgi:hypothetical protein
MTLRFENMGLGQGLSAGWLANRSLFTRPVLCCPLRFLFLFSEAQSPFLNECGLQKTRPDGAQLREDL